MEKCAFDTAICEEAFSATETNGWIDVNTPKCYDEGNRCFFLANLNGYKHVKGIEYSQLIDWTGGEYTVLSVNGYSVETGELYDKLNFKKILIETNLYLLFSDTLQQQL